MPEITREIKLDPSVVPPLDDSILTLSETETEFLHSAISADDDELKSKIIEAQKIAQHPYPCIRAFHFVNLMMSQNPIYPKVLESGKAGNTIFIDLGCCMGSDVRKLVADGYPASNVLGCDLRQEFIDCGHNFYNDSETCKIRFFTSDIFEVPYPFSAESALAFTGISQVTGLLQLREAVTHFYTGALFHLFDEATQYALALRVAMLLKRKPGTVVFGRHQGLPEAGMINDHMQRTRYGHSPTSWPLLWKKVFSEVESEEFAESHVLTEAVLTHGFNRKVIGSTEQARMLVWSVQIV
ncbi:hypothetical protein PHLCEN_2v4901 [Hermanssonia centrifuga]|uniref:Methyltransferase domain-containing protein n=1 Tax=Hermanssonia centrifuga TaxID=98765 RepID=A0A2R6PFZ3_9APHY|nr:hypothetical protein PHLCEN_2v4901 [Hermanssonia centrifuga]